MRETAKPTDTPEHYKREMQRKNTLERFANPAACALQAKAIICGPFYFFCCARNFAYIGVPPWAHTTHPHGCSFTRISAPVAGCHRIPLLKRVQPAGMFLKLKILGEFAGLPPRLSHHPGNHHICRPYPGHLAPARALASLAWMYECIDGKLAFLKWPH